MKINEKEAGIGPYFNFIYEKAFYARISKPVAVPVVNAKYF